MALEPVNYSKLLFFFPDVKWYLQSDFATLALRMYSARVIPGQAADTPRAPMKGLPIPHQHQHCNSQLRALRVTTCGDCIPWLTDSYTPEMSKKNNNSTTLQQEYAVFYKNKD